MTDRSCPTAVPLRADGRLPFAFHAIFLLTAAAVLAACASSGGSGLATATAPETVSTGTTTSTDTGSTDTTVFPEPVSVSSVNGKLDVVLNVVLDSLAVPGSGTQQLRAWQLVSANGVSYADSANATSFPGPTFRVKQGDSVRILLNNQLPAGNSNDSCGSYPAVTSGVDNFQDCFHGYNWTNIHYHGFHVTPDSVGDDVLLMIAPDSSYQYSFVIPHNQSPGTHWYHPHKHGSVAIQVSNGMSGAFIVEGGGLDSLTDSLGMTERLIAIQKVDSMMNLIDFSGAKTLVNGALDPVITMRPNEVQRWRIVNENITKTTNYEIGFINQSGTDEPTLYDVARDGVQYAPANYDTLNADTLLLMAPGNRLDVFVRAPETVGVHLLTVRSVANSGVRTPRAQAERATAAPADTLFYVQVVDDGASVNTTLPAALPDLPDFLDNLPGTTNTAQILADSARLAVIVFGDTNFVHRAPQSNPPAFFLGTVANPLMQFNDDSVYVPRNASNDSLPMVLDSVQTWMVRNVSQATNHPFHIHINPFQVIDVVYPLGSADPNAALYAQLDSAAQQRDAPVWLDVLALPLPVIDTLRADTVVTGTDTAFVVLAADTTPGYILIRQAYQPFLNADGSICTECGPATGKFVMHCHILGHEERGMMQVIEIVSGTSMTAAGPSSPRSVHPHAAELPPAPPERGEKAGNGGVAAPGGGGQHRH
jgi:L-ascorbate oxidase